MRIQLRDLTPGQIYAIQFRSNDGNNGVSDWSQIQYLTVTSDTIRPGNVLNLTFSTSGPNFIAKWDRTVVDETGGVMLDLRQYRINITDGTTNASFTTTSERFEFGREMNESVFGSFKTNLTISVWAVDLTYNESLVPATATLSASTPPTPSTPTVTNYIGLLSATWNGKDAVNTAMPTNVVYCEVHVSTTTGFTPTPATYVGRVYADGSSNTWVVSGLTYGTTYFVRLVAVNSLDKKSNPSAQATGIPARISGLDIANGQISSAMINFTAFDIGGANAYYPATTTARDALTGVKSGDIAYVTGSGYATYRYNGSTWVSAPEIGAVNGSKIVAGTVTANAVGTNLLITSAANIADAVIDNAKISTLSAGKLTAGNMSANVILSGRFATADTGARREVNSIGFQAFDNANNLTISLDGVDNLLTGTFQTSRTGKRIRLRTDADGGLIEIFDDSGVATGRIAQDYDSSTNSQFLSIGIPDPASEIPWWNTWATTNAVHGALYGFGHFVTLVVGGETTDATGGGLYVTNIADKAVYYDAYSNPASGTIMMAAVNGFQSVWRYVPGDSQSGFRVWEVASDLSVTQNRLNMDHTFFLSNFRTGGAFGVQELLASGSTVNKLYVDRNQTLFNWDTTDAYMQIRAFPSGREADTSPRITLATDAGYGATMWYRITTAGASNRFELRDGSETVWINLWAAAFVVNSSQENKSEIADFEYDALADVKAMKVKKYRRKNPKKKDEPDAPDEFGPEEIGLIAEEAPDTITEGDGTMINLYTAYSHLLLAVQQLSAEVDELKKKKDKDK